MSEHAIIPIVAEHAFLSASGSERWLNCTPSARFEEQFPDTQSEYAREGSLGHDIVKHMVLEHLGRETTGTMMVKLQELRTGQQYMRADGSGHLFSNDLQAAINDCFEVAVEKIKAAGSGAIVLVEQRLDFSRWVPQGWGTGDLVIISNRRLQVIDWKFGRGKAVEAEDNSQCRLYGLGAWSMFNTLYDFDEIEVSIMQPRLGGFKTEINDAGTLIKWADSYVAQLAPLAWEGKGEFRPGDWCGFCRGKNECRARAQWMLSLEPHMDRHPNRMSPEEIAALIPRAAAVSQWAEQLESYALEQATGPSRVRFPGYKIVEGRSNRYITNTLLAAEALERAGFERTVIMKDPELKGITELKSVVGGDKKLAALLYYEQKDPLGVTPPKQISLLEKPRGKPALVLATDSRPEMQLDDAASDFAHLINTGVNP